MVLKSECHATRSYFLERLRDFTLFSPFLLPLNICNLLCPFVQQGFLCASLLVDVVILVLMWEGACVPMLIGQKAPKCRMVGNIGNLLGTETRTSNSLNSIIICQRVSQQQRKNNITRTITSVVPKSFLMLTFYSLFKYIILEYLFVTISWGKGTLKIPSIGFLPFILIVSKVLFFKRHFKWPTYAIFWELFFFIYQSWR